MVRDCIFYNVTRQLLQDRLDIVLAGETPIETDMRHLFYEARNKFLRDNPQLMEPDNPEDLYWVFVFLSEPHPTFFVMRSDEVSRKWHERNDKYPPGTPHCGLNWGIVKQYQDQWDALP